MSGGEWAAVSLLLRRRRELPEGSPEEAAVELGFKGRVGTGEPSRQRGQDLQRPCSGWVGRECPGG